MEYTRKVVNMYMERINESRQTENVTMENIKLLTSDLLFLSENNINNVDGKLLTSLIGIIFIGE